MKILSLIFVIIFSQCIVAQEELMALETFTWTINYSSSETVTFTMQNAGGQIWAKEEYKSPMYLTNDYQSAQEIVEGNNCGGYYGFNQSWHDQGWEQFAYGLYKVTISDTYDGERTYFYLDYRYCEGEVDVTIMFDHAGDIAKIKKGVTTCLFSGFVDIPTGSLVRIWEIQGYSNPTTDCFPYFWKNSLVLIPSINNNPFLVWGPNPDLENISGYKIYRAIHSVPNPKPIVYSLIATVDDETFDYIDYDVSLDDDGDYIWYYVKAYNSQTESPGSNVVTTRGGMYKKNKFDKLSSTGYGLNQNFPNPFNPSTQIKYSLAQDADVTLKVYDMLGTEVAELVNETQIAGNHTINFNASNLSSGVYIYRITATNNGRILFTDSRQMILLR